MNANVGGMDKVLRLTAGIVLVGLTLTDMIGVWGWVGVVALATGLINWCPLYPLVGINTRKSKTETGEAAG